jgi:putative transposase
MLNMMFKLSQSAQMNWKKQKGFNDLAKLIEGVGFTVGIEVIQQTKIAA